jgi:hypothetical protein
MTRVAHIGLSAIRGASTGRGRWTLDPEGLGHRPRVKAGAYASRCGIGLPVSQPGVRFARPLESP